MSRIIAVVPCRAGSERVPQKNTRPFAGIEGGLLELKLRQLRTVDDLDVIVPTNDPAVVEICKRHPGAVCHKDLPAEAFTSTDALIEALPAALPGARDDDVILWTHCTSPFFGTVEYQRAIETYRKHVGLGDWHDSLMTVERQHEFLWHGVDHLRRPLNYTKRDRRHWPRTQDIQPVWRVDGACFMAPVRVYRRYKDRIGPNPYFLETNKWEGFDIDWPDDFERAEQVMLSFMQQPSDPQ